ncbi:type IV toxin-antitoxin system AbiEi family antitoxin [Leucothrix arctica]|uniref:AbiEi antitoxin N-terminal domain-containing protein n=1 Tax=Leucothrix arctica TaxID=1481894 RepID=A0A317CAE5_9GAMM|nr:type IV toxin-antitoxin system AbiEi family antitoxin domain-containing protein [Leucothrix arctica]PWQ95665.1 hypothetical protein DKT75_11565 [Leucothrix arctica]
MTPISQLSETLKALASPEHYLFTLSDLSSALPQHNHDALQLLLSRAVKRGLLQRVCRGLYMHPDAYPHDGLLLYHAAARLRASEFNYLSLESVLSDAGVISQIPIGWITLMSSGRNRIVDCGSFGRIEFIHTRRPTEKLAQQLTWDHRIHLWRASVALALKDIKHTHRNQDLIDWELADELV